MKPAFTNLPPKRQDQIIDGAMRVFGKHGYGKTSMDDVARAAGISKGSIYCHFHLKKSLYIEIYRRGVETAVSAIGAGASEADTVF